MNTQKKFSSFVQQRGLVLAWALWVVLLVANAWLPRNTPYPAIRGVTLGIVLIGLIVFSLVRSPQARRIATAIFSVIGVILITLVAIVVLLPVLGPLSCLVVPILGGVAFWKRREIKGWWKKSFAPTAPATPAAPAAVEAPAEPANTANLPEVQD